MASVFPTCDLGNITINPDDTLSCSTGWELRESTYPMYDLTPAELAEVMGLTAAFLAVCFSGKVLLRFMLTGFASSGGDY